MNKNNFVHHLTKVLVDVMFFGGIATCAALPFIVPPLINYLRYDESMTLPYTVILLISGICALYILWQLKAIFKTLLGGNPFVEENVSCLRRCSVASFMIALTSVIRIAFWWTIAASVIVIVFALLGLFCLTLKDVFKQAVAYKEESDWTV